MFLLWSSCWYFYLGVPAAGSDSTVRDLLDGTSTNSDRLSTSKACHSSWTCTTFLHRPIGMFLKGFGNCRGHLVTLSHLKAAYYSVSKNRSSCFFSLDEMTTPICHRGGSWPLYPGFFDTNSADTVSRVPSRWQLRLSRQLHQLDSTPRPISCPLMSSPHLNWKDLTSSLHPRLALTQLQLMFIPLTSSIFFELYAE